MSKSTRYIVQSVLGKDRLFPGFGENLELVAWVPRSEASLFSRAQALRAAESFEKHLKAYDAKDRIEIVPASGGAPIARRPREVSDPYRDRFGGRRSA